MLYTSAIVLIFLIVLSVVSAEKVKSTLKTGSAPQAKVSSFPNIVACKACQVWSQGLIDAISEAKPKAYDEFQAVANGFCNSLPDATSVTLCKDLIEAGGNALAQLIAENKNIFTARDACIALNACPVIACPLGLVQVGSTNLCVACSGPTEYDAFTAPYALYNSNAERICSVEDYHAAARAAIVAPEPAVATTWISSDKKPCVGPVCATVGASNYPDVPIIAEVTTNPWYKENFDQNWVVNINVNNVATLNTQAVNGLLGVCVCADFYRPSVYGN